MTSTVIYKKGRAQVAVPAGSKIAIATVGTVKVQQVVVSANLPAQSSLLTTVINAEYVSSAFANGATLILENDSNAAMAYYEVGVAPLVKSYRVRERVQPAPNALDATGTLTAAMIMGGIVTSSTAAAVAATVDTGTVLDAASQWDVNESVDWSVINTGGANAFTVTAATGHTLVGSGVVAASSCALFRTRKTAANTFVTYRLTT